MQFSACSALSDSSGLIVPLLTQSSLEVFQNIIEDIQLLTIVAQSVIVNFTTVIGDNIATRRNIIDEISFLLQNFFELVSPTAVVLIESEGNTTIPLGPVLPVILSGDVNFTVVKFDDDGSLSSVLWNHCNASVRNCSVVFIMNALITYADDVIRMVGVLFASQSDFCPGLSWLMYQYGIAHIDEYYRSMMQPEVGMTVHTDGL